jgi:hypothetical protein
LLMKDQRTLPLLNLKYVPFCNSLKLSLTSEEVESD